MDVEQVRKLTDAVEEFDRKIDRGPRYDWFDRLDGDYEEIKAALAWVRSQPELHDLGLRLAGATWHYWYGRGFYKEGHRWLEEQLASAPNVGRTYGRAKASYGAGILAWLVGQWDISRARLNEAVSIARELDRPAFLACTLELLGLALVAPGGDYEAARAAFQEGVDIFRGLNDDWGTAWAVYHLSLTYEAQGQWEEVQTLCEESLDYFKRAGDEADSARPLLSLGGIDYRRGQLEAARQQLELALERRKKTQDVGPVSGIAALLGEVARAQGDDVRAAEVFTEALNIAQHLENAKAIGRAHYHLGQIALRQGQPEAARERFEQALEWLTAAGDKSGVGLALLGLAGTALSAGWAETAGNLLGAAQAQFEAVGQPTAPIERQDLEQTTQGVRQALAGEAFEAALQSGRAWDAAAARAAVAAGG